MGEMTKVIDEAEMDAQLDAAIRELLVACFPADRAIFAQTRPWHGSAPAYSVILTDEEDGAMLGHVGIVDRTVRCGGDSVRVAGIQNVCLRPELRGRGHSRTLMQSAMTEAARRGFACGLLFCTPEVGAVYARQGWRPLAIKNVTRIDEQGTECPLPGKNITMFYPLKRGEFPAGESIHLQGNDW